MIADRQIHIQAHTQHTHRQTDRHTHYNTRLRYPGEKYLHDIDLDVDMESLFADVLITAVTHTHTHARARARTHTHTRLTALCPGEPVPER